MMIWQSSQYSIEEIITRARKEQFSVSNWLELKGNLFRMMGEKLTPKIFHLFVTQGTSLEHMKSHWSRLDSVPTSCSREMASCFIDQLREPSWFHKS